MSDDKHDNEMKKMPEDESIESLVNFELGPAMKRVFERFGMDDPMWNAYEYLAAKRYRNLGSCTNAFIRGDYSFPDFRIRMKKYDKEK